MLKNYFKIAYKVLLRRKFYTFISLFGIAFTLVVLMVAASLLDHLFGPYRPETRSDRTVTTYLVELNSKAGNRSNGLASCSFLERYVRPLPGPEKTTFHSMFGSVYSYRNGESINSSLKRTDGAFWDVFDFSFVEGGPFTEADNSRRNFVAVINRATRERFFGNEPAVGKFFDADGQRFQVVGVVENVPAFRITTFADIWVPITTEKTDGYRSGFFGNYMGTVLAKSPADVKRIKREYAGVLTRVESPDPKKWDYASGGLDTPFETISRMIFSKRQTDAAPGTLLAWLIGLAVLFMLLPTVNLVNLNVSRIIERSSEIGVRKSFGASSRTLVGQFIVENLVLTLAGGALGYLGSLAALHLLEISDLIPYAKFHPSLRVFLYGLAMSVFFGVFSGVYPAWKMSRLHPVEALRGGIQ